MKFDSLKIEYDKKVCYIKIQRIGQEHCSPMKLPEIRSCTYYSFHLITHGNGYIQSGDTLTCLTRGNAFILWPGVEYKYYPMEIDPWSYIWIDFYGEGVEDILKACGLSKEQNILKKLDFSAICEIMKQLYEQYNGSCEQDLFCYADLMLLFGNLIKYEKRNTANSDGKTAQLKLFRDALVYINNNFRMNLTLSQIADEMYLTEKQLITLFKKNIDMTPIEYMNKFRISLACELVTQRNLRTQNFGARAQYKLQEIAEMVGIEDVKYFMRLFKKITGMSTTEYREKCKDEDPYVWIKEKGFDLR